MIKDRKYLIKKVEKTQVPANVSLILGVATLGGGIGYAITGWLSDNPSLFSNAINMAIPGAIATLGGAISLENNKSNKRALDNLNLTNEEKRLVEIVNKGNIFDKKKAIESLRELGFRDEDIIKHTTISNEEDLFRLDNVSSAYDYIDESNVHATEEDAYGELTDEEKALFDELKSKLPTLKCNRSQADLALEYEIDSISYEEDLTRLCAEQHRRDINLASIAYEKANTEYSIVLDQYNRLLEIGKIRFTSRVVTDNLILQNSKKLI